MHINVVAAVLVVLVGVIGIHDVVAPPSDFSLDDFPSKHLPSSNLMELMNTHISISLKQLLSSKQFGSQYAEKPGLAKVLAEESDRHWDQALDTLKEYMQIGGTVDETFKTYFVFLDRKGPLSFDASEHLHIEYRDMLKDVMEDSRNLVTKITNAHHKATKKIHKNEDTTANAVDTNAVDGPENTDDNEGTKEKISGDAEVARFLLDMVKKESEMSYKMASNAIIFNSIMNNGVAFDMFDKSL